MPDERGQGGDLVLLPGEQCDLGDETKGNVTTWVGPTITTLGGQQSYVRYNQKTGGFERVQSKDQAIRRFPQASESQYVILHNPEANGSFPSTGSSTPLKDLLQGETVVIHGPWTKPLYAGQWAEVLDGHRLDPNQYLLIEIQNEQKARDNWHSAKMERSVTATKTAGGDDDSAASTPQESAVVVDDQTIPEFTTGSRLIIRGSDIRFYMPPTGVRVVAIGEGDPTSFVRRACTLERLQYAILVNSKGEKRFPKGPDVVYPMADEEFMTNLAPPGEDGRVFRAIELSEISGIYVKVTADYEDDSGEHVAGDELFITGSEQAIYYPRPEHAVIRYEGKDVHYASVVPEGEGVYVLNRKTGVVEIERGPQTLLPNPIDYVIARRLLSLDTCELYYPGNEEALEHNRRLLASRAPTLGTGSSRRSKRAMAETAEDLADARMVLNYATQPTYAAEMLGDDEVDQALAGDQFERRGQYTEPRSVVLDTKFRGAVKVCPWMNYAILINSADGNRQVVVGPANVLLEWDEYLEVLKLSTGTPKNHDDVKRTVYLQVHNNTVSHVVRAVTQDYCQVEISLSFRVNFEGDTEEDRLKWFAVENYIHLLCIHMESLIRNVVRTHPVKDFYENHTAIIRDVVLGASPGDGTPRTGRFFDENNMRVYDVEVTNVTIRDQQVEAMLVQAQREAFKTAMEDADEDRKLQQQKKAQKRVRESAVSQAETDRARHELELEKIGRKTDEATAQANADAILAGMDAEATRATADFQAEMAEKERQLLDANSASDLARRQNEDAFQAAVDTRKAELVAAATKVATEAVRDRAQAVTPDLIAAVQTIGQNELFTRAVESMSWKELFGTDNVAGLIQTVFSDTPLGSVIGDVMRRSRQQD